jgi:hypothetical protein
MADHAVPIGLPAPGGLFLGDNYYTERSFLLDLRWRQGHLHVPGGSGKGKSVFLSSMALQDILQSNGVQRGMTYIDPHGDEIEERILPLIARYSLHRKRPIRLIDPTNPEFAFSFNPLLAPGFDRAASVDLVVKALMQGWGQDDLHAAPQTTEVLEELCTALAALGLPLADATDFLYRTSHGRVRAAHLERLSELEPECWAFWHDLEEMKSGQRRDEYLAPVRRRMRQLFRSPYMRRIFSHTDRTLDLAAEMDQGTIILVNLKPGKLLSHTAARILGTLLINEYYTAAVRRENRIPHYLYLDECQLYLTPDVARILEECRKRAVYLSLAHQTVSQLRDAGERVYGAVMTIPLVRVVLGGLPPEDAELMAQHLFRGTLDLQRAMPRHLRKAAAGNELVWLRQRSATTGTNRSVGTTRSTGESASEGEAETANTSKGITRSTGTSSSTTRSWARSRGSAFTRSESTGTHWSVTRGQSLGLTKSTSSSEDEREGETKAPGPAPWPLEGNMETVSKSAGRGTSRAKGEAWQEMSSESRSDGGSESKGTAETASESETEGGSDSTGTTEGVAETHSAGSARTKSRSKTKSSGTSTSTSEGTSYGETQGESQAYITRYELQAGQLYSLGDQIHMKGAAIGLLPVGQAWVRIANMAPRRLRLPMVDAPHVAPRILERVVRELLSKTPWIAPVAAVEEAYRAHRLALEAPSSDDPEDEAGEDGATWR